MLSQKAYLSISLDVTGLFRFLAFWVATKGGSSGRRLYLSLYLFFFVAGLVVGNASLKFDLDWLIGFKLISLGSCHSIWNSFLSPSYSGVWVSLKSTVSVIPCNRRINRIVPPTAWIFAHFVTANTGRCSPRLE